MINLTRDRVPVDGRAFVAMKYGQAVLFEGEPPHDFDRFYDKVLAPAIAQAGMEPVRADDIYGPSAVVEAIWRGIQEAEVVFVDFTGKSPNVALEYGLARILGKRMVILTMRPEDVPSDLQGERYIRYADNAVSVMEFLNELTTATQAVRKEPANEMLLVPMRGSATESVPARVVSVETDFVTVRLEDGSGRHAVLASQDVTYTRRIRDMRERFTTGQRVEGAFENDGKGGMKYTLVAGQKDPWPDLASRFPPGTTTTGIVRHIADFGAFVEIVDGINGLIPASLIPNQIQLVRGNEVEVIVTQIETDKRQVSLRLRHVPAPTAPPASTPRVGDQLEGTVERLEADRGFALVRLSDGRRAILHKSRMSAQLRADFDGGDLMAADELLVEVVALDAQRGRIEVADVPEAEEDGIEAA